MKKALLVIDVQNGMFQDGNSVYKGNVLLHNLQDLIARARFCEIPIVYIQHNGPGGHPLEYRTWGWEIHSDITPSIEDIVIHKMTPDSFLNTSLDEHLKKLGVEHIIITGIQTEVCVDTTCRRAYSMGYKVTLVSDAHSTWDGEDISAQQIINHHNRVLRWFADVSTSREMV